jgi:transcriptional regulator GlxA family with amidase domain
MLRGGVDIAEATTRKMLNYCEEKRAAASSSRARARAGAMARAGLLNGKRATIHWEKSGQFLEEFEDVDLTKSIFVNDGNRTINAAARPRLTLC